MDDYHVLFQKAPVGLGVSDLEGNLLDVNEAMLAPGDYSRDDLLEVSNVAFLYADRDDRAKMLERLRESGRVWREEVQLLRRDGSPYDTLLSLVPVRFRGEECLLATVEDLTELRNEIARRRALEAELWQAQKMAALGEMTAGIAHDFNNVLSVITASAELLETSIAPDDTEGREDLEALRAAARSGSDIIRKLLGFSRKADIRPQPSDMGAIVTGMERQVRSVLSEEIECRVRVESSCTALCDPSAVEPMVMNLVTNARDAMPAGGAMEIRVADVSIDPGAKELPDWMTPGEYVQVAVTDQGIGMDEETLGQALDLFFTTKPGTSGTGLGLSMVYGLAKQHDGFIDLRSAPGEGTTASLYFPRADPSDGSAEPA